MPKLEKNLSKDFEIIDIFCKNAILNIFSNVFFTYKKLNSVYLKIDHSLLRMPKITKNAIQKQNQHAYK